MIGTDSVFPIQSFVDVTVDTKYRAAVDEDLGEDVEDAVVDFARREHQQGHEGEDDAEGEENDGGQFLDVGIPIE